MKLENILLKLLLTRTNKSLKLFMYIFKTIENQKAYTKLLNSKVYGVVPALLNETSIFEWIIDIFPLTFPNIINIPTLKYKRSRSEYKVFKYMLYLYNIKLRIFQIINVEDYKSTLYDHFYKIIHDHSRRVPYVFIIKKSHIVCIYKNTYYDVLDRDSIIYSYNVGSCVFNTLCFILSSHDIKFDIGDLEKVYILHNLLYIKRHTRVRQSESH
jgi:hypothetical protein